MNDYFCWICLCNLKIIVKLKISVNLETANVYHVCRVKEKKHYFKPICIRWKRFCFSIETKVIQIPWKALFKDCYNNWYYWQSFSLACTASVRVLPENGLSLLRTDNVNSRFNVKCSLILYNERILPQDFISKVKIMKLNRISLQNNIFH